MASCGFVLTVFVSLAVSGLTAFLLDSFASEKWDGLKVTWGPNPISSSYFVSQPRTASEAVKQGFKKVSDCDVNANWRGARYMKDSDPALYLLYDVNGFIAGIQTTVPSDLTNGYPRKALVPPFVKDGDRYVISAYFVDPAIICSTGRTQSDFDQHGTGSSLFIQNGTVPEKERLSIPLTESGMANTKWTEGKCFYTMGKHYWYNLSRDMDCQTFFPVFLLYNGGNLNGFGWAMMANITSPRYEHPGSSVYPLFMKTVPKCMLDAGIVTTMHIYLTNNVALDLC